MAHKPRRDCGPDSSWSETAQVGCSKGGRTVVPNLNRQRREAVLNSLQKIVQAKFFDPKLRGVDWSAQVELHRPTIVNAPDAEKFQKATNELLKTLRTSHVGLFHDSMRQATSKI